MLGPCVWVTPPGGTPQSSESTSESSEPVSELSEKDEEAEAREPRAEVALAQLIEYVVAVASCA